jgi:hypothetical protein
MLVSFRLMAFAALLAVLSYCLSYLWAALDAFLGPSPTAYLLFFATSFGVMTVMMFVLSLLGIFAGGKLNLE